jgi:hypothetical protein
VLITPKKDFDGIRQKTEGIEFEEIAAKKGLNYSKGREVEVVALLARTETRQ